MAESSVMREFLISLGYKIDAVSESKFKGSAEGANKSIQELGRSLSAASVGVTTLLVASAAKLNDLAIASQRTGASASNIKAFQFAIEQMGGSADGALSTLDNLRQKMRESPGYESALKNLGVDTRDANGNLRDTVDLTAQLSKILGGMSDSQANAEANLLGIDPRTLQAMRDPQFLSSLNEYQETQKKLGVDQDASAQSARKLTQELNKMYGTLGMLVTGLTGNITDGLLPAVQGVNEGLKQTTEWFKSLDPEMQASIKTTVTITAGLVALAGSLKTVATAWGIVKGLGALGGVAGAGGVGGAAGKVAKVGLLGRLGLAGVLSIFALEGAKAAGLPDVNKAQGEKDVKAGNWWSAAAHLPAGDFISTVWKRATGGGSSDKPTSSHRATNHKDAAGENPSANGSHTTTSAKTSGSARSALEFFMRAGWTKEQASGIVANLLQESGMNPKAVGDHGDAYGIAQWHNDRQRQFAKFTGHDIKGSSLEDQMRFVNYELTQGAERRAGVLLRAARNAAEAGKVVSLNYERPLLAHAEAESRSASAAQISQTTHITVNGSADPNRTARDIAQEQNGVNSQMARNFKVSAR